MEQQKFAICKQKSGSTEKMQINWCGLVNAVLPFQVYVIVLYNIVSMRCVTNIVIRSQEGHKTKLLLYKSFNKPATTNEYEQKYLLQKQS